MAPIALSPTTSPTTLANDVPQDNSLATYRAYDYVQWYVGNAKQAASHYIARLGFERVAFRGLETGSKAVASHVIRNGTITFVLTSPMRGLDQMSHLSEKEQTLLREIHEHLEKHGDAVKGMVSFSLSPFADVLTDEFSRCRVRSRLC